MLATMKMGTLAVVLGIAFVATTVKAEEMACPGEGVELVRALFTSGIESREPTDTLESISADTKRIYFYTEIAGASDQRYTYQWLHDGELVAEIPFNVMADRWRSWSSKQIDHLQSGEWTVKVIGAESCVLSTHSIKYD